MATTWRVICLDLLERSAASVGAAVERLLARADRVDLATDHERAVLAACGFDWNGNGSPPLAPITAAHDGIPDCGDLVRADPVWLRADPTRVHLFDGHYLAIEGAEADQLIAMLNAHFRDDGLSFLRGDEPARWYVRGLPRPPVATWSPLALHGGILEPDLATMQGMGAIKRIMTEAQMLLFDCPVNDARAAAGKPPITSIWPWGGGELVPAATTASDAVVSADGLALAMARFSGIATYDDAAAAAAAGARNPVVVFAPGNREGAAGAAIEQLAAGLGRRDRLSIVTAGARFEWRPALRWRWWRKATALPAATAPADALAGKT